MLDNFAPYSYLLTAHTTPPLIAVPVQEERKCLLAPLSPRSLQITLRSVASLFAPKAIRRSRIARLCERLFPNSSFFPYSHTAAIPETVPMLPDKSLRVPSAQ
jgi:hypothetical protein